MRLAVPITAVLLITLAVSVARAQDSCEEVVGPCEEIDIEEPIVVTGNPPTPTPTDEEEIPQPQPTPAPQAATLSAAGTLAALDDLRLITGEDCSQFVPAVGGNFGATYNLAVWDENGVGMPYMHSIYPSSNAPQDWVACMSESLRTLRFVSPGSDMLRISTHARVTYN